MFLSLFLCFFSGISFFLSSVDISSVNTKVSNNHLQNDNVVSTLSPTSPIPSPQSSEPNFDCFSNSSLARVVNKKFCLDADFIPNNLIAFSGNSYKEELLQSEACYALENLFAAAEKDNIHLFLVSAYRSYNTEVSLQSYYIKNQGSDKAKYIDCNPGASEHQLGLAVDLSTTDHICELTTDFAYTDAYYWLLDNCADYGFILRYPEGKQSITGIMFSPWNFRYVGVELAKILSDNGETMEEYFHAFIE